MKTNYQCSNIGEYESGEATGIRFCSGLYEQLFDINNLDTAFRQVRKASHYKPEVQTFWWNNLRYCYLISRDIKHHVYQPDDVFKFTISERGKTRRISANSCKDRVVNTVIENQVLEPLTSPKLIHDNGASRHGFGVSHSRRRIEKHLHDAMINFGPTATIDVFDLKNFFGTIPIPRLLERYKELIQAEEFEAAIDVLALLRGQLEAHNDSDVGMGIGSIISQNSGIFYPSTFDNYIKIVLGRKYYGRYMDDFYIICKDKEDAKDMREKVAAYIESLDLTLSVKKTQTALLTHGFKYLKSYYKVSESGKVYVRLDGDTFYRERRKIRKFKNTKMTEDDILQSYKSWRGNVVKNIYNQPRIHSTDLVFQENYPELWKELEKEGVRSYANENHRHRRERTHRRSVRFCCGTSATG